jgi:hypothetical protein
MTQMRGANNPLDRVGGWPDTAAWMVGLDLVLTMIIVAKLFCR